MFCIVTMYNIYMSIFTTWDYVHRIFIYFSIVKYHRFKLLFFYLQKLSKKIFRKSNPKNKISNILLIIILGNTFFRLKAEVSLIPPTRPLPQNAPRCRHRLKSAPRLPLVPPSLPLLQSAPRPPDRIPSLLPPECSICSTIPCFQVHLVLLTV